MRIGDGAPCSALMMTFGRKRPAFGSRHDNRDYSKRRAYVRFDLVIRAISAIGLLVLAVAGWVFQISTQRVRETADKRERESRLYLPIVRSLTELEFALDEVARVLLEDDSYEAQTRLFPELSSRLEFAAASTSVMGRDPVIHVDMPTVRRGTLGTRHTALTMRTGSFMIADALRVITVSRSLRSTKAQRYEAGMAKLGDRWAVAIYVDDSAIRYIAVRSEVVTSWNSWLGNTPVEIDAILKSLRSAVLVLQEQVQLMTQNVMRKNPQFGREYVDIRAEVAKSTRPLEMLRDESFSQADGLTSP
jgi:hypothetical protein